MTSVEKLGPREFIRLIQVMGLLSSPLDAPVAGLVLRGHLSDVLKSGLLQFFEVFMFGLMQQQSLLISSLIEFANRHHGDGEVVSRRVEGDVHRYTWADVANRSRQMANALDSLKSVSYTHLTLPTKRIV